jgi:hypothetical protein
MPSHFLSTDSQRLVSEARKMVGGARRRITKLNPANLSNIINIYGYIYDFRSVREKKAAVVDIVNERTKQKLNAIEKPIAELIAADENKEGPAPIFTESAELFLTKSDFEKDFLGWIDEQYKGVNTSGLKREIGYIFRFVFGDTLVETQASRADAIEAEKELRDLILSSKEIKKRDEFLAALDKEIARPKEAGEASTVKVNELPLELIREFIAPKKMTIIRKLYMRIFNRGQNLALLPIDRIPCFGVDSDLNPQTTMWTVFMDSLQYRLKSFREELQVYAVGFEGTEIGNRAAAHVLGLISMLNKLQGSGEDCVEVGDSEEPPAATQVITRADPAMTQLLIDILKALETKARGRGSAENIGNANKLKGLYEQIGQTTPAREIVMDLLKKYLADVVQTTVTASGAGAAARPTLVGAATGAPLPAAAAPGSPEKRAQNKQSVEESKLLARIKELEEQLEKEKAKKEKVVTSGAKKNAVENNASSASTGSSKSSESEGPDESKERIAALEAELEALRLELERSQGIAATTLAQEQGQASLALEKQVREAEQIIFEQQARLTAEIEEQKRLVVEAQAASTAAEERLRVQESQTAATVAALEREKNLEKDLAVQQSQATSAEERGRLAAEKAAAEARIVELEARLAAAEAERKTAQTVVKEAKEAEAEAIAREAAAAAAAAEKQGQLTALQEQLAAAETERRRLSGITEGEAARTLTAVQTAHEAEQAERARLQASIDTLQRQLLQAGEGKSAEMLSAIQSAVAEQNAQTKAAFEQARVALEGRIQAETAEKGRLQGALNAAEAAKAAAEAAVTELRARAAAQPQAAVAAAMPQAAPMPVMAAPAAAPSADVAKGIVEATGAAIQSNIAGILSAVAAVEEEKTEQTSEIIQSMTAASTASLDAIKAALENRDRIPGELTTAIRELIGAIRPSTGAPAAAAPPEPAPSAAAPAAAAAPQLTLENIGELAKALATFMRENQTVTQTVNVYGTRVEGGAEAAAAAQGGAGGNGEAEEDNQTNGGSSSDSEYSEDFEEAEEEGAPPGPPPAPPAALQSGIKEAVDGLREANVQANEQLRLSLALLGRLINRVGEQRVAPAAVAAPTVETSESEEEDAIGELRREISGLRGQITRWRNKAEGYKEQLEGKEAAQQRGQRRVIGGIQAGHLAKVAELEATIRKLREGQKRSPTARNLQVAQVAERKAKEDLRRIEEQLRKRIAELETGRRPSTPPDLTRLRRELAAAKEAEAEAKRRLGEAAGEAGRLRGERNVLAAQLAVAQRSAAAAAAKPATAQIGVQVPNGAPVAAPAPAAEPLPPVRPQRPRSAAPEDAEITIEASSVSDILRAILIYMNQTGKGQHKRALDGLHPLRDINPFLEGKLGQKGLFAKLKDPSEGVGSVFDTTNIFTPILASPIPADATKRPDYFSSILRDLFRSIWISSQGTLKTDINHPRRKQLRRVFFIILCYIAIYFRISTEDGSLIEKKPGQSTKDYTIEKAMSIYDQINLNYKLSSLVPAIDYKGNPTYGKMSQEIIFTRDEFERYIAAVLPDSIQSDFEVSFSSKKNPGIAIVPFFGRGQRGGARGQASEEEAPADSLCSHLLLLMLLAAKHSDADFDAEEFLDRAKGVFDELGGQCDVIAEFLERVLKGGVHVDAWEDGFSIESMRGLDKEDSEVLETLQARWADAVGGRPRGLQAATEELFPYPFSHSTVHPPAGEMYQEILGRAPYILISPRFEASRMARIADDHEPIELEDDDKEELEKKGLSMGELLALYLIARNDGSKQKCLGRPPREN